MSAAPVTLKLRPSSLDGPPGAMPEDGPLVDSFGRVHTDLRISVTDRCNFRCLYCLPDGQAMWLAREDILTFPEIARLASVAAGLGVRAVRLTGGEPLMRPRLPELVQMLGRLEFDDLSLTTNGVGLVQVADDLAAAGLRRVNVSCDSLRRQRFRQMTGRDALPQVLEAIDTAERARLKPVKLNVVVVRGVNDDEVLDFADYARTTGRAVRFIEFMPLDAGHSWARPQVVPGEEILATISASWKLVPHGTREQEPAPADRFSFADGNGEIGVVTSVTNAFCGTCNRLRITADGAVRNCLFSTREWSLRDAMRAGCSDEALASLVRRAVWQKLPGHGVGDPEFVRPQRTMSQIGG